MTTTHVPDPDPKHPIVLPRVLGRFDAVTVVIGSIIGSGIFLKPGIAAEYLPGSFGLIISVWIVVGLITLCGSLALAELAAMLPQAGGPYVYLREAYGRLPAFLWGWTEFWVIRTASLGALSVATVIYLNEITPISRDMQEGLAIAIVVGLSLINIVGTRWGARVQNVTSVIKVAFLVGITLLPFVMGRADVENLSPVWPGQLTVDVWRGLAMATIAVLWPYDGWINIGPVAEEIREPQRNIPFALTTGVITVILVYVAANVAYHMVLPISAIAASDGVASDVCKALIGPIGGTIMALGVMCSTFGAVNSNMLTGPRIYFAMARDGLLPKAIRRIHGRFQTPANAILIQMVWTVLLILIVYAWKSGPDDRPRAAFDILTNFVIFGGSIFYAMAVGAVFVLRRTRPELPRPYRVTGYPVVPALYLIFFVVVMFSLLYQAPVESVAGFGLILAGVGFYFWARGRVQAEDH